MNNEQPPISVSQLNQQVRIWLEQDMGKVCVIGELSNLSKPASGHYYFSLKDKAAQIRCVYFRGHHNALAHAFKDGQQVVAQGKLSLYEARGDYQLIVQSVQQAGWGELYQQFEQLKQKLLKEGLFCPSRKKPIGRFPVKIAIITSGSGAALHDVVTTLQRRYPLASLEMYSVEVQGKNASTQIISAIKQANLNQTADVIVLARGGGSIEDLWPFNNYELALAMAASTLPIVTGIGHETDFTIADFVADLRASTPTAAAEAITPHQLELQEQITSFVQRLHSAITRVHTHYQLQLSHSVAQLSSPERLVSKHWQTIDYLERQLNQVLRHYFRQAQHRVTVYKATLNALHPSVRLAETQARIQAVSQQLARAMHQVVQQKQHYLQSCAGRLHSISPLATLARGYALATKKNNAIITSSKQLTIADAINLRLASGAVECTVTKITQ